MSAATPTPRTDAEAAENLGTQFDGYVHEEFARTLERELDPQEYKNSVCILANFLPNGWITQDSDGVVCFTHEEQGRPEIVEDEGFCFWGAGVDYDGLFKLPTCEDWRESRIEIKDRKPVL